MRIVTLLGLTCTAALAFAVAGCNDHNSTAPHLPPAAPRGLIGVNGDGQATLYWYLNTEPDIAQYRVYVAPCASGNNCPYTRIGTVAAGQDSFVVTNLTNGVTRYFAVSAVDGSGYESDLSYETVFDTPRPQGTGAGLNNYRGGHFSGAGWDFSAALPVSYWSPQADIVYSDTLGFSEVYAADNSTDIQDAGWTDNLSEVPWAPTQGWSPTGSVQVIPGHTYVVWTRDNNYAKFRVTSVTQSVLSFDWAYQTDAGNTQLRARPVRQGHAAANALQAAVTQR